MQKRDLGVTMNSLVTTRGSSSIGMKKKQEDLLVPPVLMYPEHCAQFWSPHLNEDVLKLVTGQSQEASLDGNWSLVGLKGHVTA